MRHVRFGRKTLRDLATSHLEQREEPEHTHASQSADQGALLLRQTQYLALPTPIYCWKYTGDDFVLQDYNDAANDLTYGYINGLLGQPAETIYQQHPAARSALEQCFHAKSVIVRRAALCHPGLPVEIQGVARYIFVSPDLVMVQVDVTDTETHT